MLDSNEEVVANKTKTMNLFSSDKDVGILDSPSGITPLVEEHRLGLISGRGFQFPCFRLLYFLHVHFIIAFQLS